MINFNVPVLRQGLRRVLNEKHELVDHPGPLTAQSTPHQREALHARPIVESPISAAVSIRWQIAIGPCCRACSARSAA